MHALWSLPCSLPWPARAPHPHSLETHTLTHTHPCSWHAPCRLVEDTAWHPVMEGETEGWSPLAKNLFQLFLGSPLKLWASVGHWALWHFDLNKFTEKQKPRVGHAFISLLVVVGCVGREPSWGGLCRSCRMFPRITIWAAGACRSGGEAVGRAFGCCCARCLGFGRLWGFWCPMRVWVMEIEKVCVCARERAQRGGAVLCGGARGRGAL